MREQFEISSPMYQKDNGELTKILVEDLIQVDLFQNQGQQYLANTKEEGKYLA